MELHSVRVDAITPAAMLTPERLSEVRWALAKLDDAQDAVGRLLDGEPVQQPQTDRAVVMGRLLRELDRIATDLTCLFA
jgi:hypothetical protein